MNHLPQSVRVYQGSKPPREYRVHHLEIADSHQSQLLFGHGTLGLSVRDEHQFRGHWQNETTTKHTKPAITNEHIEPARFGPLVKNLRRTRKEHQY